MIDTPEEANACSGARSSQLSVNEDASWQMRAELADLDRVRMRLEQMKVYICEACTPREAKEYLTGSAEYSLESQSKRIAAIVRGNKNAGSAFAFMNSDASNPNCGALEAGNVNLPQQPEAVRYQGTDGRTSMVQRLIVPETGGYVYQAVQTQNDGSSIAKIVSEAEYSKAIADPSYAERVFALGGETYRYNGSAGEALSQSEYRTSALSGEGISVIRAQGSMAMNSLGTAIPGFSLDAAPTDLPGSPFPSSSPAGSRFSDPGTFAPSGAFTPGDWQTYVNSYPVGRGQCVDLVKAVDPWIGQASSWVMGPRVQDNLDQLQPGTPIATFNPLTGRYDSYTNGSSHAAIYVGPAQDGSGIVVFDQWIGRSPSYRIIPWNGSNASNSANAFYVVNSPRQLASN